MAYDYYDSGANNVTASEQKIGWDDALKYGSRIIDTFFGSDGGGGGNNGGGGSDSDSPFSNFPYPYRQPSRPRQQQSGNQQSAINKLIVPVTIFVIGMAIIVVLYKQL
jgi:hypothetical protein